MKRGILYTNRYKPQFSGHETFPLRYGWLKKVFDAVSEYEAAGMADEAKNIFIGEDAIARFGVGKNMVGSMRHWAAASGVISDDKAINTTPLARVLLADGGLDPWLENSSSLWVFHWNIASKSAKATYVWLFNYYNSLQFDRSALVSSLVDFCRDRDDWKDVAEATLRRDIECLVRAYVNKPTKSDVFTEDQVECPLAELGLLLPMNKNDTFQMRRGHHASLGNGTFLYALCDFWQSYTKEARTLSLEAIAFEPGSPGRVLCLDEDAIAERLYSIEAYSNGQLTWSETAGLRQVISKKPIDELMPIDFLVQDYERTSKRRVA